MDKFTPEKEATLLEESSETMNKSTSFTGQNFYLKANSAKVVNINQATFVNEKRFKQFLQEYEIQDFIGKGAFGTVQKVKHKQTGQTRAMKTIPKSNFKNTEQEQNLIKEIEILKSLVNKI